MSEDQIRDKVMFDFNNFEEYDEFARKVNRLRSDVPFGDIGKHTINLVMVLPNSIEHRQQASENHDYLNSLYDRENQQRYEERAVDEIVRAIGEPPDSVSIGSGTESFGKGASGLPQQFIELLVSTGAIYGGIRAFYDVGSYAIRAIKYLYKEYGSYPLLNRGGVVTMCAVDLVEKQGIDEYKFVSAVEAQEGHMWNPTIDGRDVYYVTFMDAQGGGHLYAVNANGAILSYSVMPLAESWEIKPEFLGDIDDS